MRKEKIINFCMIFIPSKSLEKFIPMAVDLYFEARARENFSQKTLRETYDIIIPIANLLAAKWPDKRDRKDILDLINIENIIRAKDLIKKIFPQIKKIRRDLFGKETPLFPNNLDNAIKWLKKEAKKQAQPFQKAVEKDKTRINKLIKDIEEKLEELSKLAHRESILRIEENPIIPFPLKIRDKFTGSADGIFVWPKTPLAILEGKTRFLSRETNFTQEQLIMFILTGINPFCFKYKISKETKSGEIPKRKVNIEIYRDMNYKEFIKLFHEVRIFFKSKGNRLNEKHERIYNLVARLGPIPLKRKMNFWLDFQQEWNKLYPDEKYLSSRGPRKAYLTIQKRLQG